MQTEIEEEDNWEEQEEAAVHSPASSTYSGFGSPESNASMGILPSPEVAISKTAAAAAATAAAKVGPRSSGGIKRGGRRRRSSLNLQAASIAPEVELPDPVTTAGKFSIHYKGKLNTKSLLGKGKFSMVYRVSSKKDKCQKFAVKVVTRAKLTDKQLQTTKNEASAIQTVGSHKNIAMLVDYFVDKKHNFFVFELVCGGELFDEVVNRGTIAETEIATWMEQLLSALSHCHDKHDIVHRDIKLENLMLTGPDSPEPKTLKLVDFGFAAIISRPKSLGIVGSPTYVAPEVLKEEPYGKPVDCWSVGVVLYTLLGGGLPFIANDREALFELIIAGKYSMPDEMFKQVSDDAKDLVGELLEYDPKMRMDARDALKHSWIVGRKSAKAKKRRRSVTGLRKARHSIKTYTDAPEWLVVDLPPRFCEAAVRSAQTVGTFLIKANQKSASYTVFVAVPTKGGLPAVAHIEAPITENGDVQLGKAKYDNVQGLVAGLYAGPVTALAPSGKNVQAQLGKPAPTWFVDFSAAECRRSVAEAGPGTFVVRRVKPTLCEIFINDNGVGVLRYKVDTDPVSQSVSFAGKKFGSVSDVIANLKVSKLTGKSKKEVAICRPPWGPTVA